jgi:hypothetical protein
MQRRAIAEGQRWNMLLDHGHEPVVSEGNGA